MCGLLPSGKRLQFPLEHGPVEIVDLPITNGGSVCLVFVNVYQAAYHEISKIPTYQDCYQSYTRYFSAVIVTCCYIPVIITSICHIKNHQLLNTSYQSDTRYQVYIPTSADYQHNHRQKNDPNCQDSPISTQTHTPRP